MNSSRMVLTTNKFQAGRGRNDSPRKSLPLVALLVVTATLVTLGAILAYQALVNRDQGDEALQSSGIFAVNQPVPVSFGTLIVSQADDLTGLTSQDLSGVTHGIQNLVLADQAQIQITIALINSSGHQVDFSPDQFQLVAANSTQPVQLSDSTIHAGPLQPRSSIEATLSFVVPRDGQSYTLAFRDPGSSQSLSVDLGKVDQAPADINSQLHNH